jgi:S-formylglutathione hydrolase FrmB
MLDRSRARVALAGWGLITAMAFVMTSAAGAAAAAAAAASTSFTITCDPAIHAQPITARVYVMLGPALGLQEPRRGPNWFRPQPFFAVEARDWKPGEPLEMGESAVGFPGPLADLKPGTYRAQAVVRLNPDTHNLGDGAGNAYSQPVTFTVPAEGEAGPGPVALKVDQVVPARVFPGTDRVKLVEHPSALLSAFHGRPIHHRAAVVLPEGLKTGEKRPVLFIIPGFGGDHTMALGLAGRSSGPAGFGADLVRVVLDPDCGTGHHVFADSANNGPRGRALIEELVPHLEATQPILPGPSARIVTGHSSGGWSSLWLQVAYPDAFAGVWSTSPDPVDFRDFQRIDLYASNANMFRDEKGERRPLARFGETPSIWYDDFARMEDVIGDGGQLHSFEAVFSPRLPDGRARPLWDRATGAVDPETAKAWEAYDIRLVLERGWPTLGPKLKGKLHVDMGDLDTFYLEGATRKLKASLAALGSDARIELHPGKDHGSVFTRAMTDRIDREMHETLAPVWKPAAAEVEAAK